MIIILEENMKKRILSMLMVMVMLTGVFALTGCGGTE